MEITAKKLEPKNLIIAALPFFIALVAIAATIDSLS